MDFVSWDYEIPNLMGKSFKIPWFQSPPSSSCFFPPTSSGDDYDIQIFLDIQIKHDEKPRFFTRATLHSLHLFMMSPLSHEKPAPRLCWMAPLRCKTWKNPQESETWEPSGHRFTDGDLPGVLFQGWPKKGSWDDRLSDRHPPNISPNISPNIPGVTRLLAFLSATGFFRFFLNPAG